MDFIEVAQLWSRDNDALNASVGVTEQRLKKNTIRKKKSLMGL